MRTTSVIWCETAVCEERSVETPGVRRFFTRGEQNVASSAFYTRDALSSVREKTDTAGGISARYEYDPYGRVTEVVPDANPSRGFTNHFYDRTHKLDFALYRAYDPDLGRWLNEDPLRLEGGANLFAYVDDNPIRRFDPVGLQGIECKQCDKEQSERARNAIKTVCNAVSGSEDCRSKMAQFKGMAQCMQQKCQKNEWVAVCMPENCSSDSCGGPCNAAALSNVQRGWVFFQARSVAGKCGNMANTAGHEMAHTCGVGFDAGTWFSEAVKKENNRKAQMIANACGGPQ